MKIVRMVALLLAWAGVAAAQPWIPNECSKRYESEWNEFARAMREAKPGSQIYAPKPFPKNEAEVIEDFKYGFRQMYTGMRPEEIPQDEWPLYIAVEKNTLSFRVIRVENWAPHRCYPDQQHDFYYALYMTDAASGREVGRAVVNQNGLLAEWNSNPVGAEANEPWVAVYLSGAAPRLADALAQVQARFGIKGSRAQYVTTWGQPQCGTIAPCVAFQAGGNTYLYRAGDLVMFSPASKSFKRAEMYATRTRRFEISGSIDPAKEWLVTVADDRWVVAKRVQPKP